MAENCEWSKRLYAHTEVADTACGEKLGDWFLLRPSVYPRYCCFCGKPLVWTSFGSVGADEEESE